MTRIVTYAHRPKRPLRKRKMAPLAGPAVVSPKRQPAVAEKLEPASAVVRKTKPCNDNGPEAEPLPTAGKKSAIVIVQRREKRFADVPDMTPEEHQRRGEAADALFRKVVRQIAGKPKPRRT